MIWQCPQCGLGPLEIDVFPVYHQCVDGPAADNDSFLACPHRGQAIATHACEMCGERTVLKEVYQCGFIAPDGTQPHPTCTLRRWTCRSAAIPAGEAICFLCPERPRAVITALGSLGNR